MADLRIYPFPRGGQVTLDFEGDPLRAYAGEPIAVALHAAGIKVLSRSIKYHRPRSAFCLSGGCNGCLMRVGGVPNLKACREECKDGLSCGRQNALPSVDVDVLAAADWMFPKGMDHHTLGTSNRALNAILRKVVRQVGGLGQLPDFPGRTLPSRPVEDLEVCVVGGGPAGLAAAAEAARAGRRVRLVDDGAKLGGSLHAEAGMAAHTQALIEAARTAGAELWLGSPVLGYYAEDHGGVLSVQRPEGLARLRARSYVIATGSYDQNMLFEDNDKPGVIAARAAGRLLCQYGVKPGERVCVVHDGGRAAPYAERLADALVAAKIPISVIGPPVEVVSVAGGRSVTGVIHRDASAKKPASLKVPCDVLAVAKTPAPASELARQLGAEVMLDLPGGGFRVVTTSEGRFAERRFACGDVTGYRGPAAAEEDGARVGRAAAQVV